MEASLKTFLGENKLGALVSEFEAAQVLNWEDLYAVMLQEPVFRDIVKLAVPRAKLLNLKEVVSQKLTQDSSQEASEDVVESSQIHAPFTPTTSVPSTASSRGNAVEILIAEDVSQEDLDRIVLRSPSASPPAKQPRKSDLYRYLETKTVGKLLLKQSELNGFDNPKRIKLAELVIEREFAGTTDKDISANRFKELSREIIEVFPEEEEDYYFVPAQTPVPGNHIQAKGKLFDCFNNLCKELRKAGLREYKSKKGPQVAPLPALPTGDDDSIEQKLIFLRTRLAPWDKIIDFWSQTAAHRLNSLFKPVLPVPDISEYLNEYGCLKSEKGYTLLLSDFRARFPGADDRTISHWPAFKLKVRGELEKIGITADTDAEVLVKFPCLFAVTTVKGSKGKKAWRPSRQEVSQGFLFHVKNGEDVDKEIEDLYKKAADKGFTVQPFPMVVGEDLACPNLKSYFVLERHYYLLDDPLHALEVAFKSYFALHCEFPVTASRLWFVLQKTLFKLDVPSDRVSGLASFPEVKKAITLFKV